MHVSWNPEWELWREYPVGLRSARPISLFYSGIRPGGVNPPCSQAGRFRALPPAQARPLLRPGTVEKNLPSAEHEPQAKTGERLRIARLPTRFSAGLLGDFCIRLFDSSCTLQYRKDIERGAEGQGGSRGGWRSAVLEGSGVNTLVCGRGSSREVRTHGLDVCFTDAGPAQRARVRGAQPEAERPEAKSAPGRTTRGPAERRHGAWS